MGTAFSSRLAASPAAPVSVPSASAGAPDRITPQQAAVAEIQGFADVVARCVGTCYTRCLHRHPDASLEVAEMSCTDRCVSKYVSVHQLVGETMQALQAGAEAEN
ncbi:putative inner membrane translocase subunit TIM10 [Besnoitia besnoiti]|uniref:Mitochondrial import inner membrane translocase subunit n=1 Tax=Besnoitia besnoiti TaxID=94643 RepID=A0A2A9MD39_BESBE|nr:putative inner membrane translocase subunit TIM10 [Besnoitia besnoiti]PFH33300.1 putative inner membrane translocase subunit TIM10 [Besnoitia besnoiti]